MPFQDFQSEIDFGLVVLSWIVQLIIYPSFLYYSKEEFILWHGKYTGLIGIIVMPMMVSQVALHGMELIAQVDWINILQSLMIVTIWTVTFFKAVPLHSLVQRGIGLPENLHELVKWNWPRTILWSLILLLELV